jgi:hypothetical protein
MTTDYDPLKVTVTLGGHVVTGFADGSMVTITKSEDRFQPVIGAQGDVAYARSRNESGTATINLMATSASLPQIYSLAETGDPIDFLLSDANELTNVIASSENCRVIKPPDITRGKGIETVSAAIFLPYIVRIS